MFVMINNFFSINYLKHFHTQFKTILQLNCYEKKNVYFHLHDY